MPNWFVDQRMEWIAETMRVFGFINREHIQKKFGISQIQASIDLTRFQRLHPGVLKYDTSKKSYISGQK